MSTDLELIELAAKAVGIDLQTQDDGTTGYYGDWRGLPQWEQWSPLTDDGDALRLAAALRLSILPGKHKGDGCTVETQRSGIAGCTAFYDDKAQQMRQAIVRAAAEVGKAASK